MADQVLVQFKIDKSLKNEVSALMTKNMESLTVKVIRKRCF